MFTGIIESFGTVQSRTQKKGNLHLTVKSSLSAELKIDQSMAHNGVCLTVVECNDSSYSVTAIAETLEKSNIGQLVVGDLINLERSMKVGDRLDGHIVQGHVDQVGTCIDISQTNGSWLFTFEYEPSENFITVEKGSITVNGVSLTVVNALQKQFSVAIIPYTYEHTNFKTFRKGTLVNLEFDIVGKYLGKLQRNYF